MKKRRAVNIHERTEKKSRKRFFEAVKSAIVAKTGEIIAEISIAIPMDIPQRRDPSTSPTTVV
jgi:hypothetical protein